MVLGQYKNYDPITRKITGLILVPYIVAVDTASLPTNYIDISSIENWDEFGEETTLNTSQVRIEIKILVDAKTFATLDPAEKIVASKWFVVDKTDRDLVHNPATQIENGTDLITRINDLGIDTKLSVSGTILKDSDVVDIEKELSKTFVSAGSDLNFTHEQTTPSDTWNINHNLAKFPSPIVVDSSGNEVIGEVQHPDSDNLIITFSAAFSGKAYLN